MGLFDTIKNALDLAKELKGKDLKEQKEQTEGGKLQQFEECDCSTCKFYNEAGGTCSYETCRIKTDDPLAASMITKICQFCGNEFSTTIPGMAIQLCPGCLQAALLAEGHPHECMFCGRGLDMNPSFFFPVCEKCFTNLSIVANGSEKSLELAANSAHC